MHSKPLKLSASALEILWVCHIPSKLSERSPFEFYACAREKKIQKMTVLSHKNKAETRLLVHVCWCGVYCFWKSGGLTSLSDRKACARMNWQRLYAPRTILRHVWEIWVCLVGRRKNAVFGESLGGRGGGREEEEEEMTEWQDDSSSAWHIFHLITPNSRSLGGTERDGGTQRDIKSESETGEGGDR